MLRGGETAIKPESDFIGGEWGVIGRPKPWPGPRPIAWKPISGGGEEGPHYTQI